MRAGRGRMHTEECRVTHLSEFLGGRSMARFYNDLWVPRLQPFAADLAGHVSQGDLEGPLGLEVPVASDTLVARA